MKKTYKTSGEFDGYKIEGSIVVDMPGFLERNDFRAALQEKGYDHESEIGQFRMVNECAKFIHPYFSSVDLTIDGEPIKTLEQFEQYEILMAAFIQLYLDVAVGQTPGKKKPSSLKAGAKKSTSQKKA